jgi:glycerophosphoryl diester phosphodiesterase
MKKFLILFTCTISCGFLSATAQSDLSLTNYTFSASKPIIGTIRSNQPTARYALSGPNAALFSLTKENQLAIRPQAMRQAQPWYDIILTGKTSAGHVNDTIRVVNDQFIRNQVIAHRGAWKQAKTTENSLASLNNAIKLGCMGSEFDVHMSADSVLFIHHDPTIQGLAIEKTTADELRKLRLDNGEPLPTLDAYLTEGMKQNRTRLILEIKTSTFGKERSMALTERVVKLVHRLRAQAWVDYIAFDYDVCKKVQALDPDAKVAYLFGDKSPAQLAEDKLFGFDYHYSIVKKNEPWLQEAQQRHLTVNVWTVNDRDTMEWLLARHVDFITTNEPELLLEIVKR